MDQVVIPATPVLTELAVEKAKETYDGAGDYCHW